MIYDKFRDPYGDKDLCERHEIWHADGTVCPECQDRADEAARIRRQRRELRESRKRSWEIAEEVFQNIELIAGARAY